MKNGGGQFTPKLGGHFELELGGHFKLKLGGQYHWNLHTWIKYIYKEYSKGKSLKDIKSVLEKNEIKTRRGNELWSMGSLQVILKNEIYTGQQKYRDKKTNLSIVNEVPQLINYTLWDEVQERRKLKLERKNQINRTTRFYLFRDFLICGCGTPMGGRTNPKKYIHQYYCPLTERKFNNSYKNQIECEMKKCLNIPNTDKILWDKIVEVLTDTVKIKDILKEKTLIGSSFESTDLKQILELNEIKIHELTKVDISDQIVPVISVC